MVGQAVSRGDLADTQDSEGEAIGHVIRLMLVPLVWGLFADSADTSCDSSVKVLTATTIPATENVTWSKQSALDGDGCGKWIIRSLSDDGKVKLTFSIFTQTNTTNTSNGNCIKIYDADEMDNKHSMDTMCGEVSQQVYTSRSSSVLFVFIRGDSEGNGSFSVMYSSVSGDLTSTSLPIQGTSPQPPASPSFRNRTTQFSSDGYKSTHLPTEPYESSSPPQILPSQIQTSPKSVDASSTHSHTSSAQSFSAINTEKTIRIVGIIAAILAGLGLAFVLIKVTKCCDCLRKKDNSAIDHASSSSRERVRLAPAVQQDGENGSHIHINSRADMSNSPSTQPNRNVMPSASQTIAEDVHESDSDSQQDVNEPPPSYESLYLNEFGEAATPPKYSPPVHHSSHPPRRVHTFN